MDLEAEVISEAQERCTRPFVPTASKNVKCPSSPAGTGLYIVRNASLSTGSPGTKIDKYHKIVLSISFFSIYYNLNNIISIYSVMAVS